MSALIFKSYFVPRADTQTDIFSYVHIATGKGGYFFSRTENTVIIFHLVSIVKYNNKTYKYIMFGNTPNDSAGNIANAL